MAKREATPERYLVVKGRSTALRLGLPAFGRLTLGSAPTLDAMVDEPDFAPEQARVVVAADEVELELLAGQAVVIEAPGERTIGAGGKVELGGGATVRIGEVDVSVEPGVPASSGPRIYDFARVAALFPAASMVLLRLSGRRLDPRAIEEPLLAALEPGVRLAVVSGLEWVLIAPSEAASQAAVTRVSAALRERLADVEAGRVVRGEGAPSEWLEGARARLKRVHGAAGGGLIAVDAATERVLQLADQAARTQSVVLILGETGVGKDRIAERIHQASERGLGPLVKIGPAELERALSGLEDSPTTVPPIFARAAGGTLVLDEVGALSSRAQLLLRRLLELPADVRVIAVSNHDLHADVQAGRFRKDLFFRLGQVTIAVPPLTERRADILAIAEHVLAAKASEAGRSPPKLSPGTKTALVDYGWPGNVRELTHVVEQALFVAEGDTILPEHLPPQLRAARPAVELEPDPAEDEEPSDAPTTRAESAGGMSLRDEMLALERRRILEALDKFPTQTEAAKALDIPLRTFLNRLDALGIPRARKSKRAADEG